MGRVVVTGLGAVTPIGNNINEFWNGLVLGKCGIDYITKCDTTDLKVKVAAEVKNFEPGEAIDKSLLRKTDMFTQYALVATDEAVKDANLKDYNPEDLGVYYGSGIGGIGTFMKEHEKFLEGGPRKVSPFMIPMMISNMAGGNIAIKYNAQGPCVTVVSACATGTNSIGEAYRAIKDGYIKVAIAGGAEATIQPINIAGFTNCMALSTRNDPSDASIPFDKRRDGFVMGEGAGTLILEDYDYAKARGAKIYAEIVGYGNTCDAYHMTAPEPDGTGAKNAILMSIKDVNITDDMNIYINAHGTSTPLNDKTETKAIKGAFGKRAYSVMVSSTKSMTGHMLGAAGAVEAIACIKALNEDIVPPTIGYKEVDPECDLDYVPNTARKTKVDLALSTSLGFGGHNGCLAFRKGDM